MNTIRLLAMRFAMAGVFLSAIAPCARADTLTGNEAYGKTMVDVVVWEQDSTHAAGEMSPSLSGGFTPAGSWASLCHPGATQPTGDPAANITTDFTACDIADPFNLNAAFAATGTLPGAFSLSTFIESPQPQDQDSPSSSSESVPISGSLWLLAAAAAALILVGSRILIGARRLRTSHRR